MVSIHMQLVSLYYFMIVWGYASCQPIIFIKASPDFVNDTLTFSRLFLISVDAVRECFSLNKGICNYPVQLSSAVFIAF